jgi:ABC-type dipeptide/oligopeptide/nickel transport system ATPase component
VSDNAARCAEIGRLECVLENVCAASAYVRDFGLSTKYLEDSAKLRDIGARISLKNNFDIYTAQKKLRNLCILLKKFGDQNKKNLVAKKISHLKSLEISVAANKKIFDAIEQITATICTAESKMATYVSEKELSVSHIAALTEKNTQLAELTANISLSTEELAFLNIYQGCVDKKSGISQKILGDLCGIMTVECNKILNEIAEFTMTICMEQKILRIYTIEKNVKIPASMASGYQKFIMDMILRIVLTTCLARSNNISNPNILIIDEGFGCLDKGNFVEVAKILKTLKNKFRSILIITHIDELKSYADQIINITRANSESKLICGSESEAKVMLKMALMDELSTKSRDLEKSRVQINEGQAVKKIKKEVIKKEKEDVKKKKNGDRVAKKKEMEDAKKKEEDDRVAKKKEREDQKDSIQTKAALLTEIMGANSSIKEKIIQEYTNESNDSVPMFRCLACNKAYLATEARITKHVSSTTYLVKHKKYIKTLL